MKTEEQARVRNYVVPICDQCIRLEGEACNNPECRFCRWSMKEVGEYLDALLIRPVIDGKRFDVEYAKSMRSETAGLRALVGELADALAKEGHLQGCNTYMCWHEKHDPECCDCGADDLLFRAEEARKP